MKKLENLMHSQEKAIYGHSFWDNSDIGISRQGFESIYFDYAYTYKK